MGNQLKIQILACIWIGIYFLFFVIAVLYAQRSGIIKRKMLLYFKERYPEKWKEFNQPFPRGLFNRLRFIYFKYDFDFLEMKEMKEKSDMLHKRCWVLLLIGTIWLFTPPLLILLIIWVIK